jgi:type IV pilus assembly protein PilB
MPVSETMRELIVARASTQALAKQARTEGVGALREAALVRVLDGTTSLAEALSSIEIH